MTIQIRNAEKTITAGPEKFEEFARQTEGNGLLSIISFGDGFVLLGPYGLLKNENDELVFLDVSDLHALIRGWGFKYVYQEGQPMQFSNAA